MQRVISKNVMENITIIYEDVCEQKSVSKDMDK